VSWRMFARCDSRGSATIGGWAICAAIEPEGARAETRNVSEQTSFDVKVSPQILQDPDTPAMAMS
jgi:hypothetical protein